MARAPKQAWAVRYSSSETKEEIIGAYEAEFTRQLDASVEDVWDFVTSNDTWREPFIKGVRQVSGSGLEQGARYENLASAGPISFTLINEIIEVEPERKLTWRDVTPEPGPVRTIEGSYILEPADGGTNFTLRLHSETRGLPSGIAKFFTKTFIAPKLLSQLEDGVQQHG